ncbi:hypothetical protein H2201_000867 [Coniosporium apollinis]|uniref:Heterokaryon incompatibility domain-containing protein n=1 Tax=Coniosporium apollinis TaxID=61459 RepID=A0ABQ9P4Y4_9PEZI|nr:hypothetical protein H2201_000867 [Coniosporium apollinis]
MGQVYWNAYLTIAAPTSADGNEGCFLLRGPSDAQAIALSFHTPDDIPAGQWYIYDNPDNPSSSVIRSPLQKRAWTLQERYPLRRMVHFARDQMYFECKQSLKFENCRPEYKHGHEYLMNGNVYFFATNPTCKQFPTLLGSVVTRQWSAIVENYTGRKLTKAMDKLPALSGLASHPGQLTKRTYVAGLWKGDFFSNHQLLWRVPPYDEGVVSSRAKIWRAPSWPWASIDGRVLFSSTWAQPVEPKHDKGCLDDIQLNAEVLGRDPYGQVKSSRLVATGWVVAIELLGPVSSKWEQSKLAEWVRWILRRRYYTAPHTALIGYDYIQAPDRSFFGAAAFDERVEGLDSLEALLVLRQIQADEFKQ